MVSHLVAQVDLELLSSRDPPTSASQLARVTVPGHQHQSLQRTTAVELRGFLRAQSDAVVAKGRVHTLQNGVGTQPPDGQVDPLV